MSLRKLRTQDHYKAITRELVAAGLKWREEFRGKHAALVISVNGREENEILSITPSDRRAMKNSVGHIRRRIKQWKAEAASFEGSAAPAEFPTLEKETMDQSHVLMASSTAVLSMTSREIAELLVARHDNVKRTIERLAERGIIQLPPLEDVKNHLGQTVQEYRVGKRDSYVIVAQLSPEFTARLVDRWEELERQVATLPVDVAMLGILADMESKVSALSSALQALMPGEGKALIPAFNFACSVTALEIITLAGVRPDQRVRGTSAAVTLRMKDFCLSHGYTALQTPVAIDASSRWRFPREAAQQWLYGEHHGAEFIHSHIRARRGDSTPDMFAVIKGGKR